MTNSFSHFAHNPSAENFLKLTSNPQTRNLFSESEVYGVYQEADGTIHAAQGKHSEGFKKVMFSFRQLTDSKLCLECLQTTFYFHQGKTFSSPWGSIQGVAALKALEISLLEPSSFSKVIALANLLNIHTTQGVNNLVLKEESFEDLILNKSQEEYHRLCTDESVIKEFFEKITAQEIEKLVFRELKDYGLMMLGVEGQQAVNAFKEQLNSLFKNKFSLIYLDDLALSADPEDAMKDAYLDIILESIGFNRPDVESVHSVPWAYAQVLNDSGFIPSAPRYYYPALPEVLSSSQLEVVRGLFADEGYPSLKAAYEAAKVLS